MNFLNLSLGEFAAIAGVISAGILALYLLDRSKRRQVVATLRFWTSAEVPQELKRSRRIHQPWSLLLQLLSVLLLLLAIAGPRLGGLNSTRDHVLILDTSAWMGARARQGILLDQAKTTALNYLNAVPPEDRVMLVRADTLATPVTAFESRHEVVANAIRESQPGASALNLQQALEFGQSAQRLQSQKAGEIVFVGGGRVSSEEADSIVPPPNLRVLQIPAAGENIGLRKLGVRQSPSAADSWEAFVAVRNDGQRSREANLQLVLAGSIVGSRSMTLPPGTETQSTFTFRKQPGTTLEARLVSPNGRSDSFPQDDRSVIDLPQNRILEAIVYSDQADLLKPLLTSNPQVTARFLKPDQYDPKAKADLVIFDRFAPLQPPTNVNSIWIEPPNNGSPFTIRTTQTNVKLENWRSESPITAGLYTKDLEIASTEVFALGKSDESVAETGAGPVVIARSGPVKMVALGFHPVRSSMKYELATPLLMANILRWIVPDAFRRADVQASTIGTITVPMEKGTDPDTVHVTDDQQRPLPFTVENDKLRFFSGAPGTVKVQVGNRESVYSLTLPDVGDAIWKPPSNVAKGVPRNIAQAAVPVTLWPGLAIAGGIGLLVDWLLFGSHSILRLRRQKINGRLAEKIPWRKAS